MGAGDPMSVFMAKGTPASQARQAIASCIRMMLKADTPRVSARTETMSPEHSACVRDELVAEVERLNVSDESGHYVFELSVVYHELHLYMELRAVER